MDPRSPTKIAVIGSGLMGSALARAFAAAGHDVAVWNRTPSKARAVGGGTVAFENLIEAVSGRGLVVVSVSNYAASAELFSWKASRGHSPERRSFSSPAAHPRTLARDWSGRGHTT